MRSTPCILLFTLTLACSIRPDEPEEIEPATFEGKLFEILGTEQTGINFQNNLEESLTMNGLVDSYYYNGAGLAVADFNNDGLQDIYFLSTLSANKLYLNKGGMQFEEVAATAGIEVVAGYQTGAATVDINADGRIDLYLSNAGKFNGADDGVSENPEVRKNKLFINEGVNSDGIPVFSEQSARYNLDIDLYSTQAAFFDYDRDGDLDLFLINHFPDDYDVTYIQGFLSAESPFTGDRLYQNQDGKFLEVSGKAGLTNNKLTTDLGIAVGDINNDGWPDVYVSNDLPGKDELYLNNRDGTFSKILEKSIKHIPYASMGNDMADFNNDGWIDIITLDMAAEDNLSMKNSMKIMKSALYQALSGLGLYHQYMFNALQINQGVTSENQVPLFSDMAQMAGVPSTDWSWGPLAFDMDNDGFKDLFIANGIKRDLINMDYLIYKNKQLAALMQGRIDEQEYVTSVLNIMPGRLKSDYFFRNRGNLTFEKKNGTWVEEVPTCSNGSAYADFDNDGDLDVVVNNSGGASFIYKNLAMENGLGNYLNITLEGPPENPLGIGTRIIVNQASQTQTCEQYLSRGFLSSVSPVLHVGVGPDLSIPEIVVIWPDGKKQSLLNVETNQVLALAWADADMVHTYSYKVPELFSDVTTELGPTHLHRENDFNDFERELMLPHRMSTLGPALATGDANNDGMEDLFIGGAVGYQGTLYLQTEGGFREAASQPWQADRTSEDVEAAFFDADNDGDLDLYVVSGGNEYMEGSASLQDRLYVNRGAGNFIFDPNALPDLTESGSCVVPGDFDGDGDQDLFVGGRQKPGSYPQPVSSHLLLNESQVEAPSFKDVSTLVAPMLSEIGMVTDAVWTDLDGSGTLDLVIVGEWMGVTILMNQQHKLVDHTHEAGLDKEVGWWNCLAAEDFDQDGDMDLVAGNLGLNYNFKASQKEPFRIYSGDFDNNGKLDIILGYYNQGKLYPWHGLLRSNFQLPFIKYRFNTYESFGKSTLAEIYGTETLQGALSYDATNFATSYLENNGDGSFLVKPLPNEAQISPVNGIIARDVDGDGKADLVLAGNLYGSESEITRADAGVGLFLKGNGKGDFKPVPAVKSGLLMDGDVKHTRLITLGTNGQTAIVAAKNSDWLQVVRINH